MATRSLELYSVAVTYMHIAVLDFEAGVCTVVILPSAFLVQLPRRVVRILKLFCYYVYRLRYRVRIHFRYGDDDSGTRTLGKSTCTPPVGTPYFDLICHNLISLLHEPGDFEINFGVMWIAMKVKLISFLLVGFVYYMKV